MTAIIENEDGHSSSGENSIEACLSTPPHAAHTASESPKWPSGPASHRGNDGTEKR